MKTKQVPACKPGRLDAIDSESGLVNVVIDTPRHGRCKYKYDERTGLFHLGKILPLGSSFPYDFGFVPSTMGQDGDPIDVLVLMDEPVIVGCVVRVRVIGVVEAEQSEEGGESVRNDRFIGVVDTPFNPPEVRSIHDLSEQRLEEIEHFFVSYNDMEGRRFRPVGRRGKGHARKMVDDAAVRSSRQPAQSNGKKRARGAKKR